MTLFEKLSMIQQEIKAPKNLFNKFGKYNYRNAEGILEAFKPFEGKYNVTLIIMDTIEEVGGRNYVKAVATIYDNDKPGMTLSASAYAREAATQKGMDDSQITGSASSYARKYALNGLLLLDDTKDADSNEQHEEAEGKEQKKKEEVNKGPLSSADISALRSYMSKNGISEKKVLSKYKVDDINKLTFGNFNAIMSPNYLAYFKQECGA